MGAGAIQTSLMRPIQNSKLEQTQTRLSQNHATTLRTTVSHGYRQKCERKPQTCWVTVQGNLRRAQRIERVLLVDTWNQSKNSVSLTPDCERINEASWQKVDRRDLDGDVSLQGTKLQQIYVVGGPWLSLSPPALRPLLPQAFVFGVQSFVIVCEAANLFF